ncbi:MAG: recombinase family protein, partial [Pelosinus sp.]|nr:recombinase family protein [Pelosinus sp.]
MQKIGQLCKARKSVFDRSLRDIVLDLTDLTDNRINPQGFFVENYTTDGMRVLFREAFRRFAGQSTTGIVKLTQSMGGGKTHNMIALGLLAQYPELRQQFMPEDYSKDSVGTLTTVRELKDKGVEVYFEKENIYTLDSKGELLITIMSSLAQEESRSISENVTWGQRKRFADGKVSLPYKRFLGYEKGEDGLPKIVEKEAAVVRLIYKLFLEGKAPSGIATHLTNLGIPTPSGKVRWQASTVQSILTNEKYKGDAILQKRFTVDFLTKKQKVNEGEVPQYYVENSHPAIISPEVFGLVQHEYEKRKATGYTSSISCFSNKIICGQCGNYYGSKVWHSTSKYRRTIWQCNHKFKNQEKCQTP